MAAKSLYLQIQQHGSKARKHHSTPTKVHQDPERDDGQKRALQQQVHHQQADVMTATQGIRLEALEGQADLARQLNNIQWLTVVRDADTL